MGLKASRKGLHEMLWTYMTVPKESPPIVNWNLVVIDFATKVKTIRGWFIHKKFHITGKRKTRIVKKTLSALYQEA